MLRLGSWRPPRNGTLPPTRRCGPTVPAPGTSRARRDWGVVSRTSTRRYISVRCCREAIFADRTDTLSPLECGPAIDWFSFENSFSNLLSGWDARQLFTAGQSCCEFPAGTGIELRTFFQDVSRGKWGFLPTSEYVRFFGWPERGGGGDGSEALSQKN